MTSASPLPRVPRLPGRATRRGDRCREAVRHHPRAARRRPVHRRRAVPRPGRQERRGQVDPRLDPVRPVRAGRGHRAVRRRARAARRRHRPLARVDRHGVPALDDRAGPVGRGERLPRRPPRGRSRRLAARGQLARDARARRASIMRGVGLRHRAGDALPRPVRRAAPDRRDRAGARPRRQVRAARRAHRRARARGRAGGCSTGCGSSPRPASPSCTSRTTWKRSSRSARTSPCCATASWCSTAPTAGLSKDDLVAAMVGGVATAAQRRGGASAGTGQRTPGLAHRAWRRRAR